MSEDRFKQLEARIRALEDINAGVARAFIAVPTPEPKPQQQQQSNDVLSKFPENLAKHLTVEENGKVIRTEFVSLERWNEINDFAKSLGDKWFKDMTVPKNSRWIKQ